MRVALLGRNLERVVPDFADIGIGDGHPRKFGERPQQLAARNCRAVDGGSREQVFEWIRQLLVQVVRVPTFARVAEG